MNWFLYDKDLCHRGVKTSGGFDLLKCLDNAILASTTTKMLASSGQALTVFKCL